jgi:flagellar basal body-associated protein FliL
MQTLISILIAAVAVLFAGGSFYVASKERKERKQKEKELEEARENAQNMAKADEIKENANSGNLDNDINYMGDILHQLATKK